MFKLIGFLCLLTYALAGTIRDVAPHLDGRIVGGNSTSISNYPYQISLQYNGSHICGGSIISTQWVLTAAQCMIHSTSGYTVRAGTTTRNSGGTVYYVSSVTRHASYSNRLPFNYDVAVIRIFGSFALGTNVKTIGLATSTPTSGVAVVTGWGTTTEEGTSANTLQYVPVPIVSIPTCQSYYGSGLVGANNVCAGYTAGGRDACQGDGGGPLVYGGFQVGIVSWGNGCARPNYTGVYTNVARLRSWISSITGV